MKKTCCGFGHRKLYFVIDDELDRLIEELILQHGVKFFMTGDMGILIKAFQQL